MVLGLHEACTSQGVTFLIVPGMGTKAHTSWGRPNPPGCSQEGLGESERERQARPDSVCPLCPLSWSHTATDCTHVKPSGESMLRTYYGTDGRPTLYLGRSALSWVASTKLRTRGHLSAPFSLVLARREIQGCTPRECTVQLSLQVFLARGDFSTAPGSTAIVPRRARIPGPTFPSLLASPIQARIPRSQLPG